MLQDRRLTGYTGRRLPVIVSSWATSEHTALLECCVAHSATYAISGVECPVVEHTTRAVDYVGCCIAATLPPEPSHITGHSLGLEAASHERCRELLRGAQQRGGAFPARGIGRDGRSRAFFEQARRIAQPHRSQCRTRGFSRLLQFCSLLRRLCREIQQPVSSSRRPHG